MDGFEIVLICLLYVLCALVFAALLDRDEITKGYAFIWPLLILVNTLKALLNFFMKYQQNFVMALSLKNINNNLIEEIC